MPYTISHQASSIKHQISEELIQRCSGFGRACGKEKAKDIIHAVNGTGRATHIIMKESKNGWVATKSDQPPPAAKACSIDLPMTA